MEQEFIYSDLPSNGFWSKLKKDKLAFCSFIFLIFILIITLLGYILWPNNEISLDLNNLNSSPSFAHPLGTDFVGRDILSMLICGTKLSVLISAIASIVQLIVGSVLGVIAGYYGGIIDAIVMKVVDILMSMPFFPLFILLNDLLFDANLTPERQISTIMLVIGLITWPGTCRLIRGQVLSLKNNEFMESAKALGIRNSRKMFIHLIPNTFSSMIVVGTLSFANAIIIESSLSFLGLGVPPGSYSWGNILHTAADISRVKEQMTSWIPAGLLVFLTVMSINLFGDWLKEALNPKSPVHIQFRLSNLFKNIIRKSHSPNNYQTDN